MGGLGDANEGPFWPTENHEHGPLVERGGVRSFLAPVNGKQLPETMQLGSGPYALT